MVKIVIFLSHVKFSEMATPLQYGEQQARAVGEKESVRQYNFIRSLELSMSIKRKIFDYEKLKFSRHTVPGCT